MKTPIEPSDIRAGDLIRAEFQAEGDRSESAHEFRAFVDRDTDGWVPQRFTYYLLDRPSPPIELPTEPTLGWVETANAGSVLGVWYANDRNPRPEQLLNHKTRSQRYRRDILAFTPATAVPTDALNELRKIHLAREGCGELMCGSHKDVATFLAAVDEANR